MSFDTHSTAEHSLLFLCKQMSYTSTATSCQRVARHNFSLFPLAVDSWLMSKRAWLTVCWSPKYSFVSSSSPAYTFIQWGQMHVLAVFPEKLAGHWLRNWWKALINKQIALENGWARFPQLNVWQLNLVIALLYWGTDKTAGGTGTYRSETTK